VQGFAWVSPSCARFCLGITVIYLHGPQSCGEDDDEYEGVTSITLAR